MRSCDSVSVEPKKDSLLAENNDRGVPRVRGVVGVRVINGMYVCLGTPLDTFRSTDRLYCTTHRSNSRPGCDRSKTALTSELKGQDRT
jgi:hypothetical protein